MDSSDGCASLIFLMICAAIFYWSDAWHSKWRYAWSYGIDSSHVSMEKKPDGCDFLKAPIGKKDCHYKRVVSTVEASRSMTHAPIISFDGGKTWSVYTPDSGATVPAYPTVINITVAWERVED